MNRPLVPALLLAAACATTGPIPAYGDPLVLPDGARYEGETAAGRLHGQGRLTWPNGDRYSGAFRNGLRHGRGVFVSAAGDRYEGFFADGYRSGEGEAHWADGTVYRGEFRLGDPWGEGRMERPDGGVYEGGFERGWEHGEGTLVLADGSRFSGRFRLGQLVDGRWDDPSGEYYEGEFADWQFSGKGIYVTARGESYVGSFADGQPVDGVFKAADGTVYEGEFADWTYHGEGRLFAPDGEVLEGRFEYGELVDPQPGLLDKVVAGAAGLVGLERKKSADPAAELAEQALYLQPALLEETLGALAPERPDRIDLYAVHIAGYGGQEVFRREAEYARKLFEERLDGAGRTVLLANSRSSVTRLPMATRESIRRTLQAVAETMNPRQDILFVYLTSHGSEDHVLEIDQNGMELPDLPAEELGQLLQSLDLEHKVVVVSACFSGGFISHLRDDHTLIMTAARADRTSFGCEDANDFTYFGRALLEDGLGSADDFVSAFEQAAERVRRLEDEQDLEPSEPQVHRQPAVEAQLRAWRAQF